MNITDVRIRVTETEGSKMKALASITIENEFVVHDIKIIESAKGLFVAMPSRKDGNGEYKDICHPLNSDVRKFITDAVLEKYEEVTASE
jgi:stage V sporulation protein G